ncbi:LysR substrate-binding domain-containing protein, partial [Klebsiella sp. K769]
NIVLLDRSGHRAKFTDTGRLMLEKGRQLLSAARDLEKQAQQLSAGWERELAIALDASFPFSALLPLIAEFYAQNPQTRLNFSHHTLAGSWEELTHHGADIILGAINEPPTSAEWSWQTLGALDNIFVVAPHHPLAQAKEPLANKQLSQHRAIVIRDSARYCHPLNSNLLDEQPQIGVDDFASKVELLCAGLGCGFLPRHIARPWLVKGSLVEKSVACWREKDITYMAWRSGNDGLAQRWWREALLRGDLLSQLYH